MTYKDMFKSSMHTVTDLLPDALYRQGQQTWAGSRLRIFFRSLAWVRVGPQVGGPEGCQTLSLAQSSGCLSWAAVSSRLGMDLVDMCVCLHMCVLGACVYICMHVCAQAHVCVGMQICKQKKVYVLLHTYNTVLCISVCKQTCIDIDINRKSEAQIKLNNLI